MISTNKKRERLAIKLAEPTIGSPKPMGSFELTRANLDDMNTWRVTKGLEIDLYYQGIKNIPESLKRLL